MKYRCCPAPSCCTGNQTTQFLVQKFRKCLVSKRGIDNLKTQQNNDATTLFIQENLKILDTRNFSGFHEAFCNREIVLITMVHMRMYVPHCLLCVAEVDFGISKFASGNLFFLILFYHFFLPCTFSLSVFNAALTMLKTELRN